MLRGEPQPSFVSILGATAVRIEGVGELMGHRGMSVTEYVYRHEIRLVLPRRRNQAKHDRDGRMNRRCPLTPRSVD